MREKNRFCSKHSAVTVFFTVMSSDPFPENWYWTGSVCLVLTVRVPLQVSPSFLQARPNSWLWTWRSAGSGPTGGPTCSMKPCLRRWVCEGFSKGQQQHRGVRLVITPPPRMTVWRERRRQTRRWRRIRSAGTSFSCKNPAVGWEEDLFVTEPDLCCCSWASVGPTAWPCSSCSSTAPASPRRPAVRAATSCCRWSSRLLWRSAESQVSERPWVGGLFSFFLLHLPCIPPVCWAAAQKQPDMIWECRVDSYFFCASSKSWVIWIM